MGMSSTSLSPSLMTLHFCNVNLISSLLPAMGPGELLDISSQSVFIGISIFLQVRIENCSSQRNYPVIPFYQLASNCKTNRSSRSKLDSLGRRGLTAANSSLLNSLDTAKYSCMLRLLSHGNIRSKCLVPHCRWKAQMVSCHDTCPCQKSLFSFLSQYDL